LIKERAKWRTGDGRTPSSLTQKRSVTHHIVELGHFGAIPEDLWKNGERGEERTSPSRRAKGMTRGEIFALYRFAGVAD